LFIGEVTFITALPSSMKYIVFGIYKGIGSWMDLGEVQKRAVALSIFGQERANAAFEVGGKG